MTAPPSSHSGPPPLTTRATYPNARPSPLMVASYATFKAHLHRQPSSPATPPAAGIPAPPPPPAAQDSRSAAKKQPRARAATRRGDAAAPPPLPPAPASAARGRAPSLSLTLAADLSRAPCRHRCHLHASAARFVLALRAHPAAPWVPLPPPPSAPLSLLGNVITHVPLGPHAVHEAELRVSITTATSGSSLAVAVVSLAELVPPPSLATALPAGGCVSSVAAAAAAAAAVSPAGGAANILPPPPLCVTLRRPASGTVVGSVVVRAAVTPLAFVGLRDGDVGGFDENGGVGGGGGICPKESLHAVPWALGLRVTHAASTARELRGARVVVLRVCGAGAGVAVGGAPAVGVGAPAASIACGAELLRHRCRCGGGEAGPSGDKVAAEHRLRVEWRDGRRGALLASVLLPLEDVRLLHAGDVLGPIAWRGSGGTGSRLCFVQDAQHAVCKTWLSINLTR